MATCVVLNGASGSGKSSIASRLQALWPRPLQVTGIDTFLAAQSERFFAIDGPTAEGFNWIPTTVDGEHAYDIVLGELGLGMLRASHAFWAATAEGGLDQVIDDVWLVPQQPSGIQNSLSGANVLWVGLQCPLQVLEQRELARGDRPVGTARGQHVLVHSFRGYDLTLDTSLLTPEECAAAVVEAIRARFPTVL